MAQDKVVFEIIATAKGVKVVQQQTDKLAKSSDKASKSTDRLSKSRDNYNRKEKGAAGISSNQTKNFSKMQQSVDGGGGAGGLVRAYALLAANVFALTAAFGVLSRSAQIDTLVQSMETLSTTGGIYIKNLARDMQQASGFAIDLAQSFRQVSLAASAGLNTDEIEGLTMVAKGAAISLGRNLPDAMDRIFRGAIKLEPEILDEIGLFIRVDEAAQKYARNNGKVVSSLTQVEKRQAFLNEILEQGTRKFSEYAETIKPDPYVRIGAALGDIAQSGLSLVNSVLGPLLSFLAESKSLLAAVFGVLVFTLLSKALPAMGLFAKSQAEQATTAAKNAQAYTDGLQAGTKAQVAEANKRLEDDKKNLKKSQAIFKQSGPLSKAKGAKDIDKAIANTTRGQKRINALIDKEKQLKVQIKASEEKAQVLLKEDLALLKKELNIQKSILKISKEQAANEAKGKIPISPTSNAAIKQAKLDSKAGQAAGLSQAVGMAETQNLSAGFSELNKQIKNGYEGVDEFTGKAKQIPYKFMERGSMRVKGGFALMSSGLSKMMGLLGPVMMAFAMFSPLLIGFSKWLGFSSIESKAFTEELLKVSEASEKLTQRFDSQATAMNNDALTFRENLKASIAYNKNQLETLTGINNLQSALEDFNSTATFTVQKWQNILRVFGQDNNTKTAKAQIASAQQSLLGAIKAGDKGLIQRTSEITGTFDTKQAMRYYKEIAIGEEKVVRARKAAGVINPAAKAFMVEQIKLAKERGETGARYTQTGTFNEALVRDGKRMSTVTLNLMKAQMDLNAAKVQGDEFAKNAIGTEMDAISVAAEGLTFVKAREKAQTNLDSALQGTTESMGKFNQQFMPKTKVDDILGSFNQVRASLNELADVDPSMVDDYWSSFADPDNPLARMFSRFTEDILDASGNVIGSQLLTGSNVEEAFEAAKKKLEGYQENILKTKIEIKALSQEQKLMAKLAGAGLETNKKQHNAEFEILQKKHTIAKDLTEVQLLDLGLDRISLASLEKELKGQTDLEKIKGILLSYDMNIAELHGIRATLTNEEIESLNEAIKLKTKLKDAELTQANEAMKVLSATKAVNDAKSKGVAIAAKLSALSTGRTNLNPMEEAKVAIKQADYEFENSKRIAKQRHTIIGLQIEVLNLEIEVIGKRQGLTAQQIKANQVGANAVNKLNKDAQNELISNAEGTFVNTLASSVSKGFEGGLYSGAVAAGDALSKISGRVASGDLTDEEGKDATSKVTMTLIREQAQGLADSLKELGPEGATIAAVVQGAMVMGDAYSNVGKVFEKSGEGMAHNAAMAAAAAASIGAIGAIMQANSKQQIAEVDTMIDAEKKRDGKSKESLAKITQMEKKKEALARKAFEQNKKMQIAQTIMSTAASVMQIMANPMDITKGWAAMMIPMTLALGAAQVAMIAKTKFSGGSTDVGTAGKTTMSVGKRNNTVDVSRGASSGELSYMRGERGVGSGANNFTGSGGAMGKKGYASGGEGILVGERGPEIVVPSQKVDVIPNSRLDGAGQSINFSINAVDAAGVEDLLLNQRGNIIRMIREAANDTGERFLETVDTQTYGSNT